MMRLSACSALIAALSLPAGRPSRMDASGISDSLVYEGKGQRRFSPRGRAEALPVRWRALRSRKAARHFVYTSRCSATAGRIDGCGRECQYGKVVAVRRGSTKRANTRLLVLAASSAAVGFASPAPAGGSHQGPPELLFRLDVLASASSSSRRVPLARFHGR